MSDSEFNFSEKFKTNALPPEGKLDRGLYTAIGTAVICQCDGTADRVLSCFTRRRAELKLHDPNISEEIQDIRKACLHCASMGLDYLEKVSRA